MNRPSFEKVYMDLAQSLSKRSTCARLQVGTVITSTDFNYRISDSINLLKSVNIQVFKLEE